MFKFSTKRAHSVANEMPLELPETDWNTTIWPPAIVHQVPLAQKKKPIFKEPVLQGILFLSTLIIVGMDYFHVADKVFVPAAYFVIFIDVSVVVGCVWKAERAKLR